MRELLDAGIDPNVCSSTSGTPLAAAAGAGHRAIVALLLTAGADPNIASDSGYTPLIAAVRRGDEDVVVDLLEAGAEVDAAEPASILINAEER